ncbi:MAG TPA: hypothetical protein VIL09_02555 [Microvirga sp.]
MNALWTHCRRLVASLMLVAVTSFVLHGGAMAAFHVHGSGTAECATPASPGHVHKATSHHHGGGVAHHHASADDNSNAAPEDQQTAAGENCCAGVCAVALKALAPDTLSVPLAKLTELVPGSQGGSSRSLEGHKRPPRSPSIA